MSQQAELFGQRKSARGIQRTAAGLLPTGQKTNRIKAMTQTEIDALEQASRETMVWSPEVGSGGLRFGAAMNALAVMLAAFVAALFVQF